MLADGHPIQPAELAALTHAESVSLMEEIRDQCTRRGENVLVDGTLIWPSAGTDLLRELARHDYTDVTIVDVEGTADVARERAAGRWWADRQERLTTGRGLGGRFTPAVGDRPRRPQPG